MLVIALNLQMLLGVIGSGAIAGAVLYIIGLFAADWCSADESRKCALSSNSAPRYVDLCLFF